MQKQLRTLTMLIALSPAKTMNFTTATPNPLNAGHSDVPPSHMRAASEPPLSAHAPLAAHMKKMSPAQLKVTLGVSDKLAQLTNERFQSFALGPCT